MTDELKAYPFCGGEAKCIEFYGLYHVICYDCHIAGKDCKSIETARKEWNNRPIEKKLEAENKMLICALKAIKKIAEKPPLSIYDASRIYAECCDAQNGGNE